MFLFIKFYVSLVVSCALAQPLSWPLLLPLMKQRTGCVNCAHAALLLAPSHSPSSLRDTCHYVRITVTVTPSPSLGKPAITFLLLSLLPRVCPAQHTAASQQALPHSSLQSSCWNFWTPPPKYLPLTDSFFPGVGPVASSPE